MATRPAQQALVPGRAVLLADAASGMSELGAILGEPAATSNPRTATAAGSLRPEPLSPVWLARRVARAAEFLTVWFVSTSCEARPPSPRFLNVAMTKQGLVAWAAAGSTTCCASTDRAP
jgi:hypothetical protein